jgi:23S rRNA (guanosine2251-2'-O)-methyltransferase
LDVIDFYNGNMWIYGRNSVKEALISGKPVEKIVLSKSSKLSKELFLLIKNSGVPIQWVPRSKLDTLFPNRKHQGIGAYIGALKETPFEEIVEKCVRKKSFIVFLDKLEDPGNVGNIIRSALSFGAEGLILTKRKSVPIGEAVIKASSGAVFHIPLSRVPNLHQALMYFKKKGGYVISLETSGENIREAPLNFPLCIILGSEGKGVSKLLLKESDLVVKIPMERGVGSLNVASAASIALFEIYTRKGGRIQSK